MQFKSTKNTLTSNALTTYLFVTSLYTTNHYGGISRLTYMTFGHFFPLYAYSVILQVTENKQDQPDVYFM